MLGVVTPVPYLVAVLLALAAGIGLCVGRRAPGSWNLLEVLGPWPWHIAGVAALAAVRLVGLDLPFRMARRHG
ncbi:MAG: hypothetical protein ACLQCU_12190 [Acidimicrobiales bacterium]|jgi:uncharacterized membrane protein YwaF